MGFSGCLEFPFYMKSPTEFCRGAAMVLASAVVLTSAAQGAPKKPETAPAEETAARKTSSKASAKKTEAPASDAKPKTKVAPKTPSVPPAPSAAKKTAAAGKKQPASTPAPAGRKTASARTEPAPEAVPAPPPQKKGFFKKLFGGKPKAEEPVAEPNLANAKTAKPAPVKEIKPVKPAPITAAAPVPVEEPKKKRGFFSFLKGRPAVEEETDSKVPDALKIVRPEDWQDHRVVKEDSVGLYEFGPSQSNGPDARFDRGAMVRLKRMEKGWALVETNTGRTGYMDAAALRNAEEGDFNSPVPPAVAAASVAPSAWAPAAPPPDLPDHPDSLGGESGLLLLPPLEPAPKKP
jgi:hypothetical protein